jgi:hypothetical protein
MISIQGAGRIHFVQSLALIYMSANLCQIVPIVWTQG